MLLGLTKGTRKWIPPAWWDNLQSNSHQNKQICYNLVLKGGTRLQARMEKSLRQLAQRPHFVKGCKTHCWVTMNSGLCTQNSSSLTWESWGENKPLSAYIRDFWCSRGLKKTWSQKPKKYYSNYNHLKSPVQTHWEGLNLTNSRAKCLPHLHRQEHVQTKYICKWRQIWNICSA